MKIKTAFKRAVFLGAVLLGIGTLHAAITLSPSNASFGNSGGTGSFTLKRTDGNFSYSTPFTTSASWITYSSASLSMSYNTGILTVNYKVSANTTSSTRKGTITGRFGGESFTFTITQAANSGSEEKYRVTFGKNGGTGGDNYVTVTYGKPMPTPRTAPKKEGWAFGGYWDTLACDASGNPKGKQYYNANMQSVRNWDKHSGGTLWAKWTVRVRLGKNGGTGGDDYVTVIYGQPFPTRRMPKKSGCTFKGYWVSASSKKGQCYNTDGTGTSTMKWTIGGSPTIWALWDCGTCQDCGDDGGYHYYATVAAKSGSYRYEIPFSGSGNMSYSGFTPSASWLKKDNLGISYNSGSGTFNIYYSVTANTSSSSRSATMAGTFGGAKITLHVTQSAQ